MTQQTLSVTQHPTSVESWWRTQAATMALLKHANGMADVAEKRIEQLEMKIQELEDLASSDPLTGLMNRRGFEKFFDSECARIRRKHSPGAVFVLIDLDRFKNINDTHGHQAGDECLKLVAAELMKSIRLADGASRLGGDEFVLLLSQTDAARAIACIEKIRERLDNVAFDKQGEKFRFGASLGTAEIGDDTSFADAYRRADKALYRDKALRKSAS